MGGTVSPRPLDITPLVRAPHQTGMSTMALSEYEEQRLRNISANQEILASLGLDEATLKRDRPEQSRQPRVQQPRQQKCARPHGIRPRSHVANTTPEPITPTRTRVSFRHHGLEPDADAEEVDQAMQVRVRVW